MNNMPEVFNAWLTDDKAILSTFQPILQVDDNIPKKMIRLEHFLHKIMQDERLCYFECIQTL